MDQSSAYVDPTPFECVPHWLLMDTGISAVALRIWLILRKHRNYQTGEAWPGRRRIADQCGVSVKTVDRELANLASRGAITIRRRKRTDGGDDSNMYHIHWDKGGRKFVSPPGTNGANRGGQKRPPNKYPLNKEVPAWIDEMEDGPEHAAAYAAWLKGKMS